MKTSNKFILGGIIGFILASFFTSGYFYTSFRRLAKRLSESLSNFDDLK